MQSPQKCLQWFMECVLDREISDAEMNDETAFRTLFVMALLAIYNVNREWWDFDEEPRATWDGMETPTVAAGIAALWGT